MSAFESVTKQGEIGLKQDPLIYDKEYHIWRDGKYLGTATYLNDENIGDAFIKQKINDTNELVNTVFRADSWELVK